MIGFYIYENVNKVDALSKENIISRMDFVPMNEYDEVNILKSCF
jgi:hypothetical protein